MQIANQLNYKKETFVHPEYRYNKLLPQSGQQTVTATVGGGQETIFEIPIKALNLSKSYLYFTLTPPAPAGGVARTNWAFADCLAAIRQIQLYTRGGVYLADVNEVSNYTKISWKPDIKVNEYLQYDKFDNTAVGSGVGRYLRASNSLVTSATKTVAAPFALRPDNSAANIHYL